MRKFLCVGAAMCLASCSGGGPSPDRGLCIWGSGSCGSVKPTTAVVKGIGAETTYTSDAGGVTSVAPIGPVGAASASLTFDENDALTKVTLQGPSTSRTWDASRGATLVESGPVIVAVSGNGQDTAVAANPRVLGFEYQSFGAWSTGRGTGVGTAAVLSVGSETTGSKVPTTGKGIFTGVGGGIYVDQNGEDYVVSANSALVADFAHRTAVFTTTGSQKVSNLDGSLTGASGLDLAGNLTYGAGQNALNGTVKSANGMTGSLDGRFYGPVADEAGGIFFVRGPGVQTYAGGFGTKRK